MEQKLLVEVGVNGADVEMGAAGRDPIIDFEDFELETLLEIGEGNFGLLSSASKKGYFL
jgi:hypothetical protein